MIKREEYVNTLIRFKDKNVIKVITGIRRCGKSTLFEIYKSYLLSLGIDEAHIISVNLESGEFRHIRNADDLYEYIMGQVNKEEPYYIFLDEVQQVQDFQKAVDWLYVEKGLDIYITGSNAYLLSGELATLLAGRYIEIKMLPLSFKEFVSTHHESANMGELYARYIESSAFPGVLELSQKHKIFVYI